MEQARERDHGPVERTLDGEDADENQDDGRTDQEMPGHVLLTRGDLAT
jgi:hypothetical protein